MAKVCACALAASLGLSGEGSVASQIKLGPEEFVKAGGGDIAVTAYSAPAFVLWNGDNLPDLIVGEGPVGAWGRVRVYMNKGTPGRPAFGSFPSSDSSYAQANGANLAVTAANCLGAFPRIWNAGGRKDLLVGQSDGQIRLFKNIGTDAAPTFDGGTLLQAGPAGSKTNISVGGRATCSEVDWNNDGRVDLLAGGASGYVYVYVNQGTNAAPDFATGLTVQSAGSALKVSARSSPVFADLDRDGLNDLLTGDMDGKLWFYKNTGSPSTPAFAAGTSVLNSTGNPFDLPSASRSRPFVCDWEGDGRLDILVGYGDGKVRLYAVTPEPATLGMIMALAGAGALARRRS